MASKTTKTKTNETTVEPIVVDGEKLAETLEKVGKTEEAAEIRQAAKPKRETVTRTKPAPKKAEAEAPSVDLTKALFDGLKAEGVKAKKVAPPTSSHYFKVEVDGAIVGFVNLRKGGALRVEPKLVDGRTPKGFEKHEKVRQGLGFFGTFADEKSIALAVAALKLAAEKSAAGAAGKES